MARTLVPISVCVVFSRYSVNTVEEVSAMWACRLLAPLIMSLIMSW